MNDYKVAKKFVLKSERCKVSRTEFAITLKDFVRMHNLKRCQYTGLPFDDNNTTMQRTLDRIDNTKGYTLENTVVCLSCFNTLKSVWENPLNGLTQSTVTKAITKLNKLL